jgi:hypothetical protein
LPSAAKCPQKGHENGKEFLTEKDYSAHIDLRFKRIRFGQTINKIKRMSTKKLQLFLLVSTAILAFTGAAKAQILTGSINASVYPGDQGEATASSLTLFQTNVISATTGDFIGSVPTGGYLTAYYPSTIDGLSTSPLDVSINNYFHYCPVKDLTTTISAL